MYRCEVAGCPYSHDRTSCLRLHTKNHHPELPQLTHKCRKCPHPFSSAELALQHEQVCSRALPLECVLCGMMFESRNQKSVHLREVHSTTAAEIRAARQPPPLPNSASTANPTQPLPHNPAPSTPAAGTSAASSAPAVTINSAIDNSTTNNTINNTVNNTINININVATRDFNKTDLESVIRMILSNPAELQIAHKQGTSVMHETLTAITHFRGPEANKNILRVMPKESLMQVQLNGKKASVPLTHGIDVIMNNNRKIANAPEVKRYLTPDAEQEVLQESEPLQHRRERRDVKLAALNSGEFLRDVRGKIPSWPPNPVSESDLQDMVIQALEDLADPCLFMSERNEHVQKCLVGPARILCGQYAYIDSVFFKSCGPDGWQVCEDINRSLYLDVHNLQQNTVARLAEVRDALPSRSYERARTNNMVSVLSRQCLRTFGTRMVERVTAVSMQLMAPTAALEVAAI